MARRVAALRLHLTATTLRTEPPFDLAPPVDLKPDLQSVDDGGVRALISRTYQEEYCLRRPP